MSNSLHSFNNNIKNDKSRSDKENESDNITFSISLNDSDWDRTRPNSKRQDVHPGSRLYKLFLSTDDISSNHRNKSNNNITTESKNQSSLITLSTGVLNSNNNSDLELPPPLSQNGFLVNVSSSPLEQLINSSAEYFSTSSNVERLEKKVILPPLPYTIQQPTKIKIMKRNSIANTISTDTSSTYRYYYNNDHKNNQIEPTIEEAVQLLKKDYITIPKPIKVKSEPSLSSIEFEPHEFQIIKKSNGSNDQNNVNVDVERFPRASLIDHLIVSNNIDYSSLYTPPHQRPNSVRVLASIGSPTNIRSSTPKDIQSETINDDNKHRTVKMTNSQMDLALDLPSINNKNFQPQHTYSSSIVTSPSPTTQINSPSDLPQSPTYDQPESPNDQGSYTPLPIQHIDSQSIHSYDSYGKEIWQSDNDEDYEYWQDDLFNPLKILIILVTSIFIPPLFFLIALGGNNTILSDHTLLRLVMRHPERIRLLEGFIWDIDMNWLRELCLWLGCIETFIIMACVAIGFGVGLTR